MKNLHIAKTREKSPFIPLKGVVSRTRSNIGHWNVLFLGLFSLYSAAQGNKARTEEHMRAQINPPTVFTENKGQVTDQYKVTRTDVLFSGYTNKMSYHLKKDGISYQLSKPINDLLSLYRLDIHWLNSNQNVRPEPAGLLPGTESFYQSAAPVTGVRSYREISYKNIYNQIDLHYYEKSGSLKYDFIVSPKADYKQIKLQVEGSKKITVRPDGSILLSTPLGEILEGAPIVYQNGKLKKSKWVVTGNVLSFEVEDYDPNLTLIIDPATRVWGTYYGGGPSGFIGTVGNSCAADAAGNVYLTGSTDGSNGTTIATTGSHQTTVAGFLCAFLVKFNSAGVRQWGTYYGGGTSSMSTYGEWCGADASGNVYLAGWTSATSAIATAGSHLSSFAGTGDGYLVKFNAAGVRQWGTYFGGSALDQISSGCIDASGNVYIAGQSASSSGISTAGAHQVAYSGGSNPDAFLSKFNSAGVQLWGTYYGDAGTESAYSCVLDATGNIFICGIATSTIGIATAGAHQTSYGGGTSDAFITKFNNSGVRQWGTYYGGTGGDHGISCSSNSAGDVFMTGHTNSTGSIASLGSYQSTYGGGANDAYAVKFSAAGVRQWATYLGDSGDDKAEGCSVDPSGNILFTGQTNSGTNIATSGSHQSGFGGGPADAILAKFNGTGNVMSISYYGGSGRDSGSGCFVDSNGNIYIAGSTASSGGTVIATTGGHQSSYAGPNDSFLAKFTDCTSPNPPVNTTPVANLTLCSNNTTTLSALATSSVNWFTSPTATTVLGSGNSLVTLALSPGLHTYYAEASSNTCTPSSRTPITITVNPLITVNSGAICIGNNFTLVPTGGLSYTFSSGSPVVTPTANSSYTVTGVDQSGCTGAVVSNVTVNLLPVVSVNSGSVCSGSSFTLQPTGASSYTFSGGAAVVNPTVTTSYTVTGTSADGCVSASGAVGNVTVFSSPTVTAVSNRTVMCNKNETARLTASGAATYSWSTGALTASISVSPTITTSYTVIGTGTNTCLNKAVVVQTVKVCTGIFESGLSEERFLIVPNPNEGVFKIVANFISENQNVKIYNSLGQMILSQSYENSESMSIDFSTQAAGIYVIRIFENGELKSVSKVIKH